MVIVFEGAYYPVKKLRSIFDDPKFYVEHHGEGKIVSVGYYHSFKTNNLVYMLPKVFLTDDTNTVFGLTTNELIDKDIVLNVKHDIKLHWIRQTTLYFYNSLLEYRRRVDDTSILITSNRFDLNTNIGVNEYSYLDILLSFVNFFKKNKNFIVRKQIEQKSSRTKKTKWEKTVRKSLPIFTSNQIPIYDTVLNKKKVANTEEELLTYFFSILHNFNTEHQLNLKIDKVFKIIKGKQFESLKQNGLSKLKRIKYKYFSDTLKRMYVLCELYFTQNNTTTLNHKKEDFLSVNNYNIVFEDMVDKLFSDELNNTEVNNVSLKDLKKNDDGKIIDHIYDYKSLIDTSNIFYIGDSKYYKSNSEAGNLSKYKQFTYAKNVIQFNIDLLNKDKNKPYKTGIRYRDELTEGYNITPNFFIYGYIEDVALFDDHSIEQKTPLPVKSFHYEKRLFDRDTLFVHQYKINFLFVLKSYTNFGLSKTDDFRNYVKKDFRNHFIQFFSNPKACDFHLFKHKSSDITEHKKLVDANFKVLNGKCFRTNTDVLILAKHVGDNIDETILQQFEEYSFS